MSHRHDEFNIRFSDNDEDDDKAVAEESALIDDMLSKNKIHLLYDALSTPIPVPTTTATIKQEASTSAVASPEEAKTIYTLFEYLKPEFLNHFRLNYDEVYATFCERAKPLKDELMEDESIVRQIIDTFVSRMFLNLITQDKVALKVRSDMVERIEALYDHHQGVPVTECKNDFAHNDYVTRIISERCKEGRNEATDEINARFSKPKKRGRHQKLRPEEVVNEVESIAGEYIAKRLSLAQATAAAAAAMADSPTTTNMAKNGSVATTTGLVNGIDYYPIFQQTLEIFNRCNPKLNNHGFYIQRLLHFIRTLDARQWPLHGLMRAANNMNYCLEVQTVKMNFDRSKRRFYCCFSGTEIQDGETVTLLRLVENDAERLKAWRENPIISGKPFEAPEFTRSVCAFYMKKELCCASTLFFAPFSERYKAHFPDYFNHASSSTTTTTTTPIPAPKASKKRVTKPKRKASDKEESMNGQPLKKPRLMPAVERKKTKTTEKSSKKNKRRIMLSDVKCEDECLFDSLSAPVQEPALMTIRVAMATLCHVIEEHLARDPLFNGVWFHRKDASLEKNYSVEKMAVKELLDAATKKSFIEDLQGLIIYGLLSSPPPLTVSYSEETMVKDVAPCYAALLDFVEALMLPDKKLSLFAAPQQNVMVRGLMHETRRHSKARPVDHENVFAQRRSLVDTVSSLCWLKRCPLVFLFVYSYMVAHDADGYLKQANQELVENDKKQQQLALKSLNLSLK